jgi:hypothetical protein
MEVAEVDMIGKNTKKSLDLPVNSYLGYVFPV